MNPTKTLTAPPLADLIADTLAAHMLVAVGNNGGFTCDCGWGSFVLPMRDPIGTDEPKSKRRHQAHVAEEIAALDGAA